MEQSIKEGLSIDRKVELSASEKEELDGFGRLVLDKDFEKCIVIGWLIIRLPITSVRIMQSFLVKNSKSWYNKEENIGRKHVLPLWQNICQYK